MSHRMIWLLAVSFVAISSLGHTSEAQPPVCIVAVVCDNAVEICVDYVPGWFGDGELIVSMVNQAGSQFCVSNPLASGTGVPTLALGPLGIVPLAPNSGFVWTRPRLAGEPAHPWAGAGPMTIQVCFYLDCDCDGVYDSGTPTC